MKRLGGQGQSLEPVLGCGVDINVREREGGPRLLLVPGVSETGIDGYSTSSLIPWSCYPEAPTHELGAVKLKLAGV